MFMPYYKEQIDYTAIDILADLELLFRHVDYIASYRLLGGEPLLNKRTCGYDRTHRAKNTVTESKYWNYYQWHVVT